MSSTRLPALVMSVSFLASALFMTGCQTPPKKESEAPTVTPDKVASLRESITKAKPGSMVGEVIAVLSDKPYAAVTDITGPDVKLGQPISFVDANGTPTNNGTIVAIVGDTLHVKFDPSAKHTVQVGDIAVWLKE